MGYIFIVIYMKLIHLLLQHNFELLHKSPKLLEFIVTSSKISTLTTISQITLLRFIHHLFFNPRESKHHHNFSNNTMFHEHVYTICSSMNHSTSINNLSYKMMPCPILIHWIVSQMHNTWNTT